VADQEMKISVIGAGTWGSALALLLAGKGYRISMWDYDPRVVRGLNNPAREIPNLPGCRLPADIHVFEDPLHALEGAELVLLAVPSHGLKPFLLKHGAAIARDTLLVDVAKGIDQDELKTMSEVCADSLPHHNPARYVCLSGPSHAEEVCRGIPTAVVAASSDVESARETQEVFSTERFRVYANDDLMGVELGGSLKNVIALAAGMCDGLGFGDNTKGALMTRGMVEMARLGTALGGRYETFWGLSGMGDLITTCSSRHSRNRHVGEEIGKGRSLEQVLAGMNMVAEGVRTTESAWRLAKREKVEMPITESVYRVLFGGRSAASEVERLMTRELKDED
jgi:glycerol-3-phosphate dehydrogenase (NAD(P)+)